MASIEKSNGHLRVTFRVPGYDGRIREALGIKATKENLAFARREVLKPLERELAARDYAALLRRFPSNPRLRALGLVPPAPLSVAAFARTVWLEEMRGQAGHQQRLSTMAGYECILRRWLEPCPALARSVNEFSPADGAAFAAWLAEQDCRDSLRRQAFAQLGRILKRARDLGRMPVNANPLAGLSFAKAEPVDAERLGAWTMEERERLIAAAYELAGWVGCAVETAFFTGLRRGELFGLKWSDLDFERGSIRVQRSLGQNYANDGTGQAISAPKTAGSAGTIEMLPRVRDALQRQRQRLGLGSLWVFPARGAYPQQVHNFVSRVWPRIVDRASVPYRPFKQTRHTFAVLALEAGGEGQLLWTQRMLRHASSQMLINHYLKHATPKAPSADFVRRFEERPGLPSDQSA